MDAFDGLLLVPVKQRVPTRRHDGS